MTFTEIQTRITDYLLLSSSEADTRVGNAINQHYKRLTAMLGMDTTRFTTITQTTTNGVATVTFAEIEKIDRILDTTDSTDIRLLQETSIHDIRSNQPRTGEPLKWAVNNTDADSVVVRLDTLPQSTYSLQADGVTTLSTLSGSQEPVFPESFHDILVFAVISEELLKKGNVQLAREYERKAGELTNELRFHLADTSTYAVRQGGGTVTPASGGGGSGGSVGGTAYTQSALLTFDLGAGVAPFAVAQSDAAVVTNLDADKLDGQEGSYYTDADNLDAGTVPDARFPATLPAASGVNLTALVATQLTTGTVPAARLPAGTIIQIVTATYSTETDNSTSTPADTGLTVSITPTSSSNKVLVVVCQAGCQKGTGDTYLDLDLLRDSTKIVDIETQACNTDDTGTANAGTCGTVYLDSPATGSSVTYKTQSASGANTAYARVQANSSTSTILVAEVVV